MLLEIAITGDAEQLTELMTTLEGRSIGRQDQRVRPRRARSSNAAGTSSATPRRSQARQRSTHPPATYGDSYGRALTRHDGLRCFCRSCNDQDER